MQPGLYEQLLTLALQQDLEGLADPRLYTVAPVDAEDAHAAIAQFLEHMLASALAAFRGSDAGEQQRRLVDRIIATLTEELGHDWTRRLNVSTPLRRLLAIHAAPRDSILDRPDTRATKFSSASDTGPSTVVLTSVRESCTSRHPKSMLSS